LRPIVGLIGSLILSWSFDPTSARAAEQPKAPPQASEIKQAPPAPVAIPAAEIIPRAEQTLRALQETRFQIAADSDAALNALQSDIAAFAERSDRRWQDEAEVISELRSLQWLNDILRQWSVEQSQLDGWNQALARRSRILVAQENEIAQISETWQATRAAGKQQNFPNVAMQRVTDVLREADALRQLIRTAMAKLLNLQIQLANRRDILVKIRSDIDKARDASSRQLFALDSPPLWNVLFKAESRDANLLQAIQSSQRFLEDLQEFMQKYSVRLVWHALFFLALLLLFRLLRRGLAPETVEGVGGASTLLILNRVIASSFLLVLIPSPLFYRGTATAILRIALVTTVIPVIRLLPGLLPKFFRRWVPMLVTLYVLDFLRYLLPAGGLLMRLLLLLIATGGCAGLGLFLRLRAGELAASGPRERLALVAIRLVLFLFAVSVASNVVGNVTLAEILVAAPIRIAYAAALAFAGAHLLMTLMVVALQSRATHWLRSVREHGELIAFRCRSLIRFVFIVVWIAFSLYTVGVLEDISTAAADFLQVRWKLGAAEISMYAVASFFAVLLVAHIFSRMLRFVLSEEILPRIRLPRGAPGAVDALSRYGIMLLGFFIALAAAGVDLSKVTLLISALGVGIGFGLQSVVNNFVSGLILIFEHPVQVGDVVEVGSSSGEVRRIGYRASVLRTPDGADVIIPNAELVGARFTNWSLSDRLRRISIPVGVAYGSDPDRVTEILLGVARKHPAVLAHPAPFVIFDRFGDSALNFTLFCWSLVDRFFIARSELTIAINNAFKEAGIQIPFPQQEVHLHWPDRQGAAEASEPSKDIAQSKSAGPLPITGKGRSY
jgi:small-conductance mechanosensitive channel